MKKTFRIIGCIVLILAVVTTGVRIYFIRTPEYALLQIKKDVKEEGVSGLEPHLTGDAKEKLQSIMNVADNK